MEGLRISHYRILRRLGSGGMGEVYAAEDERLRRDVAIKFITLAKAADENAGHRFEREAQAASALNHPNICTIFEVSEHEGQPFLVKLFEPPTEIVALLGDTDPVNVPVVTVS
jgi:eukaryotic-like serine/threonine-protein kinase